MEPKTTQTAIPGTERVRARRQTVLQKAIVGDLVVTYATVAATGATAGAAAIEQVSESMSATLIVERWKDLGLNTSKVEVWEVRPGGYYRRRTSR